MKFLVFIERINLLNKLIKQSRTGNPCELSRRLGLSTSRMHRVIEELRAYGAPIAYSRQKQTYYYKYDYEISISASFRELNDREKALISGGGLSIKACDHTQAPFGRLRYASYLQ